MIVDIAKHHLSLATKVVCDRVNSVNSWHVGVCIGDHFSILHPHSANLDQVSIVSSIVSQELSDNSEGFCCVKNKLRPWSVELVVPQSPRVQVTAVLITNSIISLAPKSTRCSLASFRTIGITWMGGVCRSHAGLCLSSQSSPSSPCSLPPR